MSFGQAYSGWARYLSDYPTDYGEMLVAVPCHPGAGPDLVYGLLDTAAQWCVMSLDLAEDLGCPPRADDPSAMLHTRFGRMLGQIARVPLVLPVVDGEALTVEATFWISDQWSGPTVIGWKGCLERIRFAIDPQTETFYFADSEV